MSDRDLFGVVFESASLLVVNKPAGLVCHPTKTDAYSSLIGRVRLYLGPEANPRMINRLDRETSGITLVAKDTETARTLGKVWENRQVEKEYLAIVSGHVESDSGVIEAPLGKDERSRVAIKDCVRPDGAPAQTEFRVERRFLVPSDSKNPEPFAATLLRVRPRTGRKHQIRIHLQHVGHPIVGDKLYGLDEDLYLAFVEGRLTDEGRRALRLPFHALHATRVSYSVDGGVQEFCAEPEPWFSQFAAQ